MKRYALPLVIVASIGFGPMALAQETGRTERTERTEGTARTERTERTEGTGRTERGERTPGTSRTPRSGAEEPGRLPTTGSTATSLAMDGATLLGAGFVLMRLRRRVLA